jgi:hypothetical protein
VGITAVDEPIAAKTAAAATVPHGGREPREAASPLGRGIADCSILRIERRAVDWRAERDRRVADQTEHAGDPCPLGRRLREHGKEIGRPLEPVARVHVAGNLSFHGRVREVFTAQAFKLLVVFGRVGHDAEFPPLMHDELAAEIFENGRVARGVLKRDMDRPCLFLGMHPDLNLNDLSPALPRWSRRYRERIAPRGQLGQRQRPKERRSPLAQKDRETAIPSPAVRPRTSAFRPRTPRCSKRSPTPATSARAEMPRRLGEEVGTPAFPR